MTTMETKTSNVIKVNAPYIYFGTLEKNVYTVRNTLHAELLGCYLSYIVIIQTQQNIFAFGQILVKRVRTKTRDFACAEAH